MKPLFKLAQVTHLYYSDKPLPQVPDHICQRLTIEEISAKMARHRDHFFTWTSDIMVPDSWILSEEDQKILQELSDRIIPEDSFVICYHDRETGYGVYAKKKINKGSIVPYSGKVSDFNPHETYDYGSRIGFSQDGVVDAKTCGGHAPLFQDLFPPEIVLPSDFPYIVARNNFMLKRIKLSCATINYLEALCDIEALNQCGNDYGDPYWQMMHRKNDVLKQYYNENGLLFSAKFSNYLLFKTLNTAQLEKVSREQGIVLTPNLTFTEFSPMYDKFERDQRKKAESLSSDSFTQSFHAMKGIFDRKPKISLDSILKKYKKTTEVKLPDHDLALRRAAALGNYEDAEFLLTHTNINLHATSSNGLTALDWAVRNKQEKIAELLRAKLATCSQACSTGVRASVL